MPSRELEDLPYAPFLEPWDGTLMADVRYDTVHFDGRELEKPIAIGAKFIESALTSMTFDEGSLRLSRWSDVWMKAVRWLGTDLSGTDWMDVDKLVTASYRLLAPKRLAGASGTSSSRSAKMAPSD